MMRKIIGVFLFSVVVAFTAAPMATAQSSGGGSNCNARFLTAPPWYRGVTDENCNVSLESVNENIELGGRVGPFLLIVGLNIVEIMMHLVAYISVGYIIFGGFKYMTSAGSQDGSVKARKTITNAVIGLIISLIAVGVITFIVGRLT